MQRLWRRIVWRDVLTAAGVLVIIASFLGRLNFQLLSSRPQGTAATQVGVADTVATSTVQVITETLAPSISVVVTDTVTISVMAPSPRAGTTAGAGAHPTANPPTATPRPASVSPTAEPPTSSVRAAVPAPSATPESSAAPAATPVATTPTETPQPSTPTAAAPRPSVTRQPTATAQRTRSPTAQARVTALAKVTVSSTLIPAPTPLPMPALGVDAIQVAKYSVAGGGRQLIVVVAPARTAVTINIVYSGGYQASYRGSTDAAGVLQWAFDIPDGAKAGMAIVHAVTAAGEKVASFSVA